MSTDNTTNDTVENAILARVHSYDMDALRAEMATVDSVASDGGYDAAKAVADTIGLTKDELAQWVDPTARSKADGIGTVVNQIHDEVAPNHGPTRRGLMATALRLALDACPEEDAWKARNGDGTKDTPQYKLVPKPSTRGDNKKNAPLTDAAAFTELNKRYNDASAKDDNGAMKDEWLASLYADAIYASTATPHENDLARYGDATNARVSRIRAMASKLQAQHVAAGRFRSLLFLPVIAQQLSNFQDTSTRTIGSVWSDAAAKAKAAHAEYMSKLEKGKAVDQSDLITAIRDAATEYLNGKNETVQKAEKPEAEKIAGATDAMFANARKLHDLNAIGDSFADNLAKAVADGLFNDGQFLTAVKVVMGCADLKGRELERLAKEETERQEQQAKKDAAEADALQRKIDRDAKKAAAVLKAQQDIEAKAQAVAQQQAIDKLNADEAAANQVAKEESAEDKLANKRAKKVA